jgi:steroid delta-isomerase-like uncharacterized protein
MKYPIALLVLCLSLTAYAEEVKMSTTSIPEQNKELVRKVYDYINSGKLELIADLVSADYSGPAGPRGTSGFINNLVAIRTGFPDIRFTLQDLIAEEDRVMVRWQWKGTHRGMFAGFPASQNTVTNEGISIYQLKGGRSSVPGFKQTVSALCSKWE